MKKVYFCLFFCSIFLLTGCDKITPAGKQAIAEGAKTALERSRNFEAIKDKITAKNPEDVELIEQWKKLHSEGLAAEAKALADINTIVNGNKKEVKK